jgi:hypothetical protein
VRRGGGIVGRYAIIIASRVIHKFSGISPLKRLIFPKNYPQKKALFLPKTGFFSLVIHNLRGVIHNRRKCQPTIFMGITDCYSYGTEGKHPPNGS